MKVMDLGVAVLMLFAAALLAFAAVVIAGQDLFNSGMCVAVSVVLGLSSVYWMTRYTVRAELKALAERQTR